MSDWSANLKLPYMAAAQSQKHVTYNEALELLDAVAQLVVVDFDATTPPGAPEEGQVWALGAGATGAWAGQDGDLAIQANGGWVFLPPRTGWRAARGTELRVFDGTAWVEPDLPALQQLPGMGIGTAFDAVNVLAVAGPASLFTGDTDGHQIKINKGQAADTASVLFQTGFSGRAEMGTAGDDDFAVKVSDNGTDWTSAIIVDHVTGAVSLPQGLDLGGTLSLPAGSLDLAGNAFAGELPLAAGGTGAGSAAGARSNLGLGTAATAEITTSPTDATPGRITRVRDYGWGVPPGESPSNNAAINNPPATGAYTYSSSAHGPTGFGGVLSFRGSATRYAQIAVSTGGPADRMYFRQGMDDTHAAWLELYHTGNLVGTVSQSGGVPTGGIIQRGSNSNGEFVRFADGTQICWHSITRTGIAIGASTAGVFLSDVYSWTYPASFGVSASLIVPMVQNVRQSGYTANTDAVIHAAVSSNSMTYRHIGWVSQTDVDVQARLMAIGRWI